MYAKSGVTLGTGVAMLPNTGNNRVLFAVAVALLTVGAVIFVASFVSDRKARSAAK